MMGYMSLEGATRVGHALIDAARVHMTCRSTKGSPEKGRRADALTQQLGATLRISEQPEQELPPLQQLLKLCGQPVRPNQDLLVGKSSCLRGGWP